MCSRSSGVTASSFSRQIMGIVMALVAAQSASAAISSSGSVLPSPPQTAGADPVIGVDNIGRFTITPSSVVTSDVAIIGRDLTGIGYAVVSGFDTATGSGAVWNTNNIIVGSSGTGSLEILDGAIVTVDFAGNPGSGDLVIGQNHDSVGTVVVSGRGSLLRIGDDAFIGHNTSGPGGTGTLIIEDEGFVVATNDAASGVDTVAIGGAAASNWTMAGCAPRTSTITALSSVMVASTAN